MEKNWRHIKVVVKIEWKTCFKVSICIFVWFLCFHYRSNITGLFGALIGAADPLLIGCVVAYLVNILIRLMGILGMLLGVPLAATIDRLLRKDIHNPPKRDKNKVNKEIKKGDDSLAKIDQAQTE